MLELFSELWVIFPMTFKDEVCKIFLYVKRYYMNKNNRKGTMNVRGIFKGCLKICFIFGILLSDTSSAEMAYFAFKETLSVSFWYSLLPLQSYHTPPSSQDICSWVCNRWHSTSVVCRNRTGSFLTVHHSHLVSSDDRKKTLSNTFTSGPSITTPQQTNDNSISLILHKSHNGDWMNHMKHCFLL